MVCGLIYGDLGDGFIYWVYAINETPFEQGMINKPLWVFIGF